MGLGDHPETFLLKALCCQPPPSALKVGGGWVVVACEILLSALGLFRFSILDSQSHSQSQSQSLDNIFLNFTCIKKEFVQGNFHRFREEKENSPRRISGRKSIRFLTKPVVSVELNIFSWEKNWEKIWEKIFSTTDA